MPDQATSLPIAGLMRRLMAIVYDSLLLLGVAFAYGIVLWLIRKLAGDNTLEALSGLPAALGLIGLVLVLSGYFVFCWTKRGQTLGMKSWRLQVESLDGRFLTAQTAWLRCLLAVVSALPCGLGYLWCLLPNVKNCWHDRWTKSRVVVLPKKH